MYSLEHLNATEIYLLLKGLLTFPVRSSESGDFLKGGTLATLFLILKLVCLDFLFYLWLILVNYVFLEMHFIQVLCLFS